jgi:bifunctional ADP-heptose synthase (sugar kinase/adenylyltransferase)
LERVRGAVDELIVAVMADEPVRALKGKDRPLFPFEHRFAIIEALRYPTHVLRSDSFDPTEVFRRAEALYGKIDVFFKTDDQTHVDTSKIDAEVVVLGRTPGISSTEMIARLKSLDRTPE